MNIYFINLDSSTERREAIETNLGEFAGSQHAFHRVSAYDRSFVETHRIPGRLRPSEKACFLSHIKAIEQSLDDTEPSLFLEDDAIFGTHTGALLTQLSAEFESKDIVFTDPCIPTALSMMRLFTLRRSLKDRVAVLNFDQLEFAGSTAYSLNARSKRKLLNILKPIQTFDVPYDIVLKSLILNGSLTSGFVFPFITSLSPHASQSQIQTASDQPKMLVWNAFRKLSFLESERFFPDLMQEIEAIPFNSNDRDTRAFSALCGALACEAFGDLLQ